MTPSSAEDFFLTVTPCCCTSGGSLASATCTRLLTLTVLMSGSVPSSNEAGERVAAVVAADALHVDHLVDADDLRLDRLRDRRVDDAAETRRDKPW